MFRYLSNIDLEFNSRYDANEVRVVIDEVLQELKRATDKFPPYASSHEGAAIILEEVDEFWYEVKKNNVKLAKEEALQVATTTIRYLLDVKEKN